jgi:prevent-host-death family protein
MRPEWNVEKRVGIRKLKAQLSEYVREIKRGNTIVITERGNAVGRMIPVSESLEDRIQTLIRSGVADWNGRKLRPGKPAGRIKAGSKTLAEIVSENRD